MTAFIHLYLTSLRHVFLGLPLFFLFPLWTSGQSLPGDVAGRLPEGVTDPTLDLPLSLPLYIPGQGLPGDVAGRLPEGVANPTLDLPLSLPLYIPGQGLPGDVAGRLPEGVANPTLDLPFSLPLYIPGQSLPGDVAGRLSEGVANPTPLSSTDLCRQWFLCLLPSTGPHCLSSLATGYRGFCPNSC